LCLAHAIGIRGEEQGKGVKFNRIVLQTLTFTTGPEEMRQLSMVPSFYQTVDTGIIN